MKPSSFGILAFTALIIVCGCVPTITKMYNGPEVTGTVIRLSDLSAVEGAIIAYHSVNTNTPISTAYSDTNGEFTLLPVVRKQFEVRMPAHAYKHTTVYTTHTDYAHAVNIVVSVQMNREYEYYSVGDIILDDTPTVIAAPLTKNGIDIKLLKQASAPYQFLTQCDDSLVAGAINKLNITRKLAKRLSLPNQALSSRLEMQFEEIVQQTNDVWRHLANTCDAGDGLEMARLKYQVLQELEPL
jgi:hypothetical protein